MKCYSKTGPKTTVAALKSDPMEEAFLGTLTAAFLGNRVGGHTIPFGIQELRLAPLQRRATEVWDSLD